MIDNCKRLAKDRYFMLSVYGLCCMSTPIIYFVFMENMFALSELAASNGLVTVARHLELTLRSIWKTDILMFVCVVMPFVGIAMVAVAWSLMLRRSRLEKSKELEPPLLPGL